MRHIQSVSIKNVKNVKIVAVNKENVLKGHLFELKPFFVLEEPEKREWK